MPAVCSGPPQDGHACGAAPAPPQAVVAALTAVLDFVRRPRRPAPLDAPVGPVQRRRVAAAERYMSARLAGRNDDVLRLVADDVQLESSRDGRVAGKEQFKSYLGRVKPTGTWKPATWNRAIGKAEILGNVKILMVNVGVVAHLSFNRAGKISRIYVGTRRSAGQ